MRPLALPLALALALAAPAAAAPAPVPPVVILEAVPESGTTEVVRVEPDGGRRLLGRVAHAPGSARRGALWGEAALLVVEEQAAPRTSYDSALFRLAGGAVRRLAGGLADASRPLVTAAGTVLVQRGRDGPDPVAGAKGALREAEDDLEIAAVDPAGGARTVWRGRGQIAYLAAPLAGDEALVYHVGGGAAWLLALDAASARVRVLAGPFDALARDFSVDAAGGRVVFARAARHEYEIVALPVAPGGGPQVLFRAPSPHLMPRALSGGAVAFSTPGDRGLALLEAGRVRRLAPAGDGSDAALGESSDGRWLAVRHTDRADGAPNGQATEALLLVERAGARRVIVSRPGRLAELAGFPGGAR